MLISKRLQKIYYCYCYYTLHDLLEFFLCNIFYCSRNFDTPKNIQEQQLEIRYTCLCCKAFYIGKTDRQLGVRICEHMGISPRIGKPLSVRPHSDIFEHCQKCKVPVSQENFSIEEFFNQNLVSTF